MRLGVRRLVGGLLREADGRLSAAWRPSCVTGTALPGE